MTHVTRTLIAASIGLLLLALPLVAGAKGTEGNRDASSEDDAAQTYGIADYGKVELTTIEEIANGEVLDLQTIRFLEDNLWVMDSRAEFAEVDEIFLDLETIRFLEDNVWDRDPLAVFADEDEVERELIYEERIGLRAY